MDRTEQPRPAPSPDHGDRAATARATTPAAAEMDIICRDALGLPEPRADERRHELSRVMIHHTAVASESASQAPARLRGHTNFHREQGWPDIAYHYAVDLAGNVYELREPELPGDTFTDYDPASWLLIVCEGNFDHAHPTDAMLDGAAQVLAYARDRYGLALDTLAGHRDYAAGVSCPGDHLYASFPALQAAAERYLSIGGVRGVDLCGDPGRDRVAAISAGSG